MILLLTFVFVFSFGCVAMADTTYRDKDGNDIVTVPDMPDDIKSKLGDEYVVYYRSDYSGELIFYSGIPTYVGGGIYDFGLSGEIYRVQYVGSNKSYNGGSITLPYKVSLALESFPLIYSTSDVLSSDGSVFFQAPKAPVLQTVLRPINLGGSLSEVILLIPLVISAVLLYLGLRKALAFVLSQLRQA